jgi:hypothetical protein
VSHESTHHGDVKAAGVHTTDGGGAQSLRAVGIAAAVATAPGVVTLTLLEAIGADEFHAHGGLYGGIDGSIAFQRTADTTVVASSFDAAGAPASRTWSFRFSRLSTEIAGIVPAP